MPTETYKKMQEVTNTYRNSRVPGLQEVVPSANGSALWVEDYS